MIGFLTMLGYSLYDTVVVFDKVRENTNEAFANGRLTFAQAANLAVNQTLVRSINTTVIGLLPITAVLFVGAIFLGPGVLLDLSLVLFVGILIGTYSSIFIATPLLVSLRRRDASVVELEKKAVRAPGPQGQGRRSRRGGTRRGRAGRRAGGGRRRCPCGRRGRGCHPHRPGRAQVRPPDRRRARATSRGARRSRKR